MSAKTAIILGGGAQADAIAGGLKADGVNVTILADAVLMTKVAADDACRAQNLATNSADIVIIPVAFEETGASAHVADMDEVRWKKLAEDPLVRVRNAMQCASELVCAPGGAILLLVPTIGITGVAELAAQSMATEGARSMAKSAARVWNQRGVTVNSIALSLAQIYGQNDGKTRPTLAEIGKLAVTLAAARAATGTTVFADGELTSV